MSQGKQNRQSKFKGKLIAFLACAHLFFQIGASVHAVDLGEHEHEIECAECTVFSAGSDDAALDTSPVNFGNHHSEFAGAALRDILPRSDQRAQYPSRAPPQSS